jgi:hypothetical protein
MLWGRAMAKYESKRVRMPMRVQARSGSQSEAWYRQRASLPGGAWPMPRAIAPGIDPAPLQDLIFHGGKVVPQMEFQNVYLGGSVSWQSQDVTLIDAAIELAMRHKRLNNVMVQYFPGAKLGCDMRASIVVEEAKPKRMDEPDVQAAVVALVDGGQLDKRDLETCIFNLILPAGTVLKLGSDTSLRGLGGYHGSVHVTRAGKRRTIYYSASVFSQILADGRENGIAVFDRPWKNVVGTLYHEINEFRTDADVNDAILQQDDDFLGWMSRSGSEVGDQPIFAAGDAGDLRLVFKEVQIPPKRVPVQFMYSNAVHGAEGPIAQPHT